MIWEAILLVFVRFGQGVDIAGSAIVGAETWDRWALAIEAFAVDLMGLAVPFLTQQARDTMSATVAFTLSMFLLWAGLRLGRWLTSWFFR